EGMEADLLAREFVAGTNARTLYEAVAQGSALFLMRDPNNEEHIVTGILCMLDMMRDERLPGKLRLMALLTSLSSSRIRYNKSMRDEWLTLPVWDTAVEKHLADGTDLSADDKLSDEEVLARIVNACREDETGDAATLYTAQYVIAGRDVTKLTTCLMQLGLETQGPFFAIHFAKMLWGQWKETQFSTAQTRWVHLASAARYVARMMQSGLKSADLVLNQW
ncbi:MAG: hypothetical protein ACXVC1_04330, partial [Tumebacillaceae bacterium]